MNVQILENAQAIGAAVGQLFVEQVKTQPDSVLGLATGSSPIPTYQYMAQEYAAGHVSFRNVTTFNLFSTATLRMTRRSAHSMKSASRTQAVLTCSCSALATTATSDSTSRQKNSRTQHIRWRLRKARWMQTNASSRIPTCRATR